MRMIMTEIMTLIMNNKKMLSKIIMKDLQGFEALLVKKNNVE
jgi:hypothetical protein